MGENGHFSKVADVDGDAIAARHDDVAHVREIFDQSRSPDKLLFVTVDYIAASSACVVVFERAEDILERKS